MSGLTLKHFKSESKKNPKSDNAAGYLDVSKEGVCPKSGKDMVKVRLVACKHPQMVWWSPETRVVMPMSNPDLL